MAVVTKKMTKTTVATAASNDTSGRRDPAFCVQSFRRFIEQQFHTMMPDEKTQLDPQPTSCSAERELHLARGHRRDIVVVRK